jgi:hypothetical protein
MEMLKGRLFYFGLGKPCSLEMVSEKIDLFQKINEFFESLKGKHAVHIQRLSSYTLKADSGSKFIFEYVPNELAALTSGSSLSNVLIYLDTSLIHLSGRKVKIEIESGERIFFTADNSEKVHGVYTEKEGSLGIVPIGIEEKICKKGTGRYCCIFLSFSNSRGCYFCQKFNIPIARALLNGLHADSSDARRIGNCKLLGRAKT